MGYSCTVEQERDAIDALEGNGIHVNSETIAAYLNDDVLFFQELTDNELSESGSEEFEFELSGWD